MNDPVLADRMLYAADVLEELSKLYDAFDPAKYEWSAEALRNEARVVGQ